MDTGVEQLDWSLVASFLAVAEEGSFSAAAKQLGLTQPTVGRHIRQLEDRVGLDLFVRQPRGLRLTDQGVSLLGPAKDMRRAAKELELKVAGQSDQASGTVRVTATVYTSNFQLPGIVAGLRQTHPDIHIELVPTDGSENLLFREADIALRMYRSSQLEIVTRKIGDLGLGIFAATSFLDRVGRPETFEDMLEMEFVGYDRNDLILRGMHDLGITVARDWFPVRCDHQCVYYELMRAGAGIGFAQTNIAGRDPALEQLFPDFPIQPFPLWIAAHEAVRRSPRVRIVWDALIEGLKPHVI